LAPKGKDKKPKKEFPTIKWIELGKGLNKVLRNAERLNDDADLLLKNKRYPSATFCALLAKEEIGKFFLLADIWAAKRDVTPQDYELIFKSHKRKLAASGRGFLKTEAWQNMPDFFAEHDQESKEVSLYVDYAGTQYGGYWKTPEKDYEETEADFAQFGIPTDIRNLRRLNSSFEELYLTDQIKRSSAIISSLRGFVNEQGEVLESASPSLGPVLVAPARQPPRIVVTNEFSVDYLLGKYEEFLSIIARLGPRVPEPEEPAEYTRLHASLSHEVPTLEKLRGDVNQIPSEAGKKAFTLYHLGLLRTNVFMETKGRVRTMGRKEHYDEGVKLMNECATKVLIPFNGSENPVKAVARIARNIRPNASGPLPNYPRQWRSRVRAWPKNSKLTDWQKKFRAYVDLEQTFSMLHAMSFSSENFPRLDELTQDELNRFLVTGHFP
jgi:AbiV family abortive infection protein